MFKKLFLTLFFLLIISDIYIYFLFIRKRTQNKWLRGLWFLPSVLLLIGLISFYVFKYEGAWGTLFIIYVAVIIPKLLFTVISLLDIPLRYFFRWKIYPFTTIALVIAISAACIILYGSIFGKTRIQVNKIDFISPSLPESFSGYKIAHISDLHLGNWKNNRKFMTKVIDVLNRQNPDALMITGDLVHHSAQELNNYEDILAKINTRQIYSVLGNHDYGPYFQWESQEKEQENLKELKLRQAKLGWYLLNNEHHFIVRGNDSIAIIGVENAGKGHFADYSDLVNAMKGTENISFKILLSHDPSHWRSEVLQTDINLTLSGHTHGSQFSLGSFSFAALAYPEWGGLYMSEKQGLYVNVGIGHVGIPFRFGAWPEITIITLKRGI